MMSASHDEAQMDVPQAHESVDSRTSVAGRQISTAELAQMEAAGCGFAQQFSTSAASSYQCLVGYCLWSHAGPGRVLVSYAPVPSAPPDGELE